MRILILGATGMLGHTLFFYLSRLPGMQVWGTVRALPEVGQVPPFMAQAMQAGKLLSKVDAYDFASIANAIAQVRPEVVINCIGLIRHLPEGQKPWPCIEINARLPYLLLDLCREHNIRLIHYSTDCVFDGHKGMSYIEEDSPTAHDIYGISKYLGELHEAPALTIRTSIIGHELRNGFSLVEWFLAQQEQVNGYSRAIYSGLPTSEHARILAEYILPNPSLYGLYQVAANPISKFELLQLIAREYDKKILVNPDDRVSENKTLNAEKFYAASGYIAPPWPELVAGMKRLHQQMLG